ncbi:putative Ferredoxin--NAD(+) reductase [Crenothrix polyspora]|uniref:Putative Ferredoxin--NAD(+) reductase n=1 Tax=Crenothrix polyspora TaxID=360316 RepID=A0A1R4HCB1_9GAMM|nr:FAD-dependent oxidoreductase [Crenothrix polyspora]SJM93510.1 putative Ferredoxin--NAD(+) reductase [Crenothrix polyspora]
MHGMVFGELKKFVDKNLGGDSWLMLLKEANLASRSYVPVKEYPDNELMSLVSTASTITGLEKAVLLKSFGEFMVPNLLLLFRRQIEGNWNAMDMLENIESTIHKVVRLRNPGAKPPQLRCERVAPEHVIIHYTSTRKLCHFGIGLATGIANQFGDPYTLEESTCMLHGDDSCQIHIKLDIPVQQATLFSSLHLVGSVSSTTSEVSDYVEISPDAPPIVIVGSGPVGIHAAREIIRQAPRQALIVYGAESWEPYNRVRLSDLLAGEVEWDDIANKLDIPAEAPATSLKINLAIASIDRKNKYVVDSAGNKQHYSRLILAVGSRARRVDETARLSLSGIYSYRDVDDAQDLMTNVVQSMHTVVTGGGVLGIEVAFALKAQNPAAEITILHRRDRLMNQQLDEEASAFLLQQVYAEGIKVLLNTDIVDFIGQHEIERIQLNNGQTIPCDTLISCTGIIPNTSLASDAGLNTDHGIVVNDFLQTNDPDIYAIGECAEHHGKTYGLIGPGLEQATLAVSNILQGSQNGYTGTTISMRVKVKHLPIFSVEKGLDQHGLKKLIFKDAKNVKFREVVLQNGVLVGATTIGAWPEAAQVQEAVNEGMEIRFWHRLYFSRTGSLWPVDEQQNPAEWPVNTIVCSCNTITRGELGVAIADGCTSIKALSKRTGAALACGSCVPLLAALTGAKSEPVAPPLKGPLFIFMSIALACLLGLALPAFTPPASIQDRNPLLPLLFDNGWRQISGYVVFGFMLLSFVLSLNKRWQLFQFASYNFWRVVHVALMAVAVGVLMLHTNMGLGQGFNFQLMVVFLLTLTSGTLLGLLVIFDKGFFGALLRKARTFWLRPHILIVWVLFAFLSTHVFSVYYF